MTPIEPETVEAARGGVYAEMKHDVMCERRAGDPDWVTEEQCTCLLPDLLNEYEAAVRAEERARERKRLLDLIAAMLPAQASRVQDMVHALDGPAEGEVTE